MWSLKLKISNFHPDSTPSSLTQKIDDDSTQITVASGTNFETFEGKAVSDSFPGFVLIEKEIIAYTGVSGNNLTGITGNRGIDQSLKSNHAANVPVFKYEFNGVSLRKINKDDHDIDPREKTFDSYFVKVSTASTEPAFITTKSGGGGAVHASQNIPFEVIDPQITSLTPTGTNISARIKTTSGTSLSGNEASFSDLGYENVALNKLNYLNSPRMIASKTNETSELMISSIVVAVRKSSMILIWASGLISRRRSFMVRTLDFPIVFGLLWICRLIFETQISSRSTRVIW